jgi:hypothetical protein
VTYPFKLRELPQNFTSGPKNFQNAQYLLMHSICAKLPLRVLRPEKTRRQVLRFAHRNHREIRSIANTGLLKLFPRWPDQGSEAALCATAVKTHCQCPRHAASIGRHPGLRPTAASCMAGW